MSRPRANSGDAYVYFLRAIADLRPRGERRTVSAILRDYVPMWRGLTTGRPSECANKWAVIRFLLPRLNLGGVQWLEFDLSETLDYWLKIGPKHPDFGHLFHQIRTNDPASFLLIDPRVIGYARFPTSARATVERDPIRRARLRLPRKRYLYPRRPAAVDQLARWLVTEESEADLAREFHRSVPAISQNIHRWRAALRLPSRTLGHKT